MTKAEHIDNLKGFIDHFETQIKQAKEIGDTAFDVERAERDIETFKAAITVLSVIDQVTWERDVAIEQLKELGYGLGEKPRTNK